MPFDEFEMTDEKGQKEQDLSRIGVSLPSHLLESFDAILYDRGYSSRSEGIRDAIRTYIRYYKWMGELTGERQGVITLVYDHHQRNLLEAITEVEHQYSDMIHASLHSHVTHSRCVEILLIRGDAKEIKKVSERLMSLKGVESVKLTTIPLEG